MVRWTDHSDKTIAVNWDVMYQTNQDVDQILQMYRMICTFARRESTTLTTKTCFLSVHSKRSSRKVFS